MFDVSVSARYFRYVGQIFAKPIAALAVGAEAEAHIERHQLALIIGASGAHN